MSTHAAGNSTAPQTRLGPFSSAGASPTPWEATEWALRRIEQFQLCTVRRDGRPHVTSLLAIWALGAMWFTTGDNEQKAKNLRSNQYCALTTGTDTLTGMDYIIEGTASLVSDQATREAADREPAEHGCGAVDASKAAGAGQPAAPATDISRDEGHRLLDGPAEARQRIARL